MEEHQVHCRPRSKRRKRNSGALAASAH
jgi:hypothetical protein